MACAAAAAAGVPNTTPLSLSHSTWVNMIMTDGFSLSLSSKCTKKLRWKNASPPSKKYILAVGLFSPL